MKLKILLLLLTACALAGCGDTPAERAATDDAAFLNAEYYVQAPDQDLTEDNLITISRVRNPVSAFVAIHTDADGQPSETVLGYQQYDAGLYAATDFAIELSSLSQGDNTLWAVLHIDEGQIETFEFPGVDVPITLGDGTTVMDSFVLTK